MFIETPFLWLFLHVVKLFLIFTPSTYLPPFPTGYYPQNKWACLRWYNLYQNWKYCLFWAQGWIVDNAVLHFPRFHWILTKSCSWASWYTAGCPLYTPWARPVVLDCRLEKTLKSLPADIQKHLLGPAPPPACMLSPGAEKTAPQRAVQYFHQMSVIFLPDRKLNSMGYFFWITLYD